MTDNKSRREFIRDTATVAAALTAGLAAAKSADAAKKTKKSTGKILNYNPEMEYRRAGCFGDSRIEDSGDSQRNNKPCNEDNPRSVGMTGR